MSEIIKDAVGRMDKSFSVLQDSYRGLNYAHSGGFLDSIKVEYFGSHTPLNQLASITRPYTGKFSIRPHDPTCVKDIERAIVKANLNLGVSSEKTCVNVSVPSPTTDQKKDMAKHARKLADDAKVAVRKIRQDARTKLKKAALPEDDEKKADKQLQEQTDAFCSKIDAAYDSKEKQLING